ncbi:MAG: sugar ABC transporter permease [Treponema sp.]|nr:sugar ABC transporter permease [Treponema sp.]
MKNKKTTQSTETELILKRSFWKSLGKQKQLIVMSLPFVLYIILFKFVPLTGWTMAFQDYKPAKSMFNQTWVGFKWFLFLFKDKEFLFALRNTIAMSLMSTALGYISAILIAILLNEVKTIAVKRFVQTVSYLPHFLSWIIVTGLVANVLSVEDGILNNILLWLGIIDKPILWLSVPKYFWHIIAWTYVWKEVGWNTIVYLGAMTAIDPCLYEAAQIDGCGRLRKIWHITLPGIKPTIIIMMIMSAGHILDANFEMPYFLQNGLIQEVATQIDIYVLKYGFKLFNFSLATAAGIFKNVVNILLLLAANYVAKKAGEERLI